MPKLSIIVPVYKVEKYLRKCLDSILAQTFKDFEVIVINDASPDNSQIIIDEYKKKDSRIISIINKENSGIGKTRNIGLGIAKGKYITFVDSDDWIEKEMYQEMLDTMVSNTADAIECNINRTDKNNLQIKNLIPSSKTKITTRKYINYLIENKLAAMVWNKIYKTEIIKNYKIKFIEEKKAYHEDLLFNISYMRQVNLLITINKPFYNYTIRPDSISQRISSYSIETNILIINYYIENNKNHFGFNNDFIYFSSVMLPVIIYPTMGVILNTKDFKKKAVDEIKKIRRNDLTFSVIKNYLKNKNLPYKHRIICLLIVFKMYYLLVFLYYIFSKIKKPAIK
jgi:glycosyltransferase involved in cell wall biosynthesis